MRYQRDDAGYDRLATLDIETTHWKATDGETVSVGIAVHDRDGGGLEYEPFQRDSADDEADVIADALEFVDYCGAEALVSFNGRDFDMGFLHDQLYMLGESKISPDLDTPETHTTSSKIGKRNATGRERSGPNSRSASRPTASTSQRRSGTTSR